ncbi:hypothetical protein CJ179_49740 [Rhodococcus sp. ACS1]|uniref:hypothetical protein n=1 Tax=Rhodococcus TaxID=1827 RepID=UPI0006BB4CC2|nr:MULTISPECIES: hypothetical protein [Rhodococcus]RYF61733.1 MAG: hypothetical protein EOO27_00710 [Comamonadaceae bacterium]KXX60597.1 hypothetical protein AZG88_36990 [Rhodococcus sp. LB1]MBC2644784.1 hypothetical protein [Rhodococcus sp. 3A]MBC2890787.1 hypothetical protein [Rhodococcus sp. 4CII]MDI9938789.1 hypothetical protein [Rhodococcus sp. IEGM 1351]
MFAIASTVVDLSNTAAHPSAVPGVVTLAQEADVNTRNLRDWIGDNVVFTILAVIACVVLIGGLKGNLSKVFTVGGLTVVGLAFLGIANSETAAAGVGNWFLGLIGLNPGA